VAVTNAGAGAITVNGVELLTSGGGTDFLADDGTYKPAGGGGGSGGAKGDHIQVNLTATAASVLDNGRERCPFNQVFDAGGGGLSLTGGKITLTAGKRYRLSCHSSTAAAENFLFYDFTNALDLSPQFNNSTSIEGSGCMECIVSPSSNIDVGLATNSVSSFKGVSAAGAGVSMMVEEMPVGEDSIDATVSTTDATVTTCGVFPTASNQVYHVEVRVVARETVASAEAASYKLLGTFKNDGGVLSPVGSVTVEHAGEDTVGWDATLDASGTDIRTRVTGAAATNIDWKSRLNAMNV
jgi:hypothetical protein